MMHILQSKGWVDVMSKKLKEDAEEFANKKGTLTTGHGSRQVLEMICDTLEN